MTRHLQYLCASFCIGLLAFVQSPALALEKWSRQLEATDPGVSDSFDWIPVAQPADSSTQSKDRSGNGRVLTYSQAFPSNSHFSDLTKGFNSQVSPKPTPFDFPYQFQNFASVPQTQALKQPSVGAKTNGFASQEPTSQSFFKFEMPLNQQSTRHNAAPLNANSGVNTGYQISHAFGGGAQATLYNSPLFNQQPVFPPEFHPIASKPQTHTLQQQKPLTQQNFLNSEPISLKNYFKDSKAAQPSTLQSVTPQVFPQIDSQADNVFSLRNHFNSLPSGPAPSVSTPQQDLQYLYVPYNDIFNQIPQPQQQQVKPQSQAQTQPQVQLPLQPQAPVQNLFQPSAKLSTNLPTVNPYQINQFYTPDPIGQQRQPQLKYYTSTTSTTIRPPVQATSLKPPNIFQNFVSPQYNTTPKPKPKAHQPPLAMFLLRTSNRPSESDIVDILSGAKTIAVIDAPTQNTPEIFVGPSGMPTPNGYIKFDLPYLSQLQGAQNINDVAFFVAPLSYRTPGGFNKILLPEPHVGSIVVNLAKSTLAQQPLQQEPQYYQPQPQQPVEQTSTTTTTTSTTHRPRLHSQRVKSNSNRGNKFSYYYDQDPIQEVASPQVLQKERPKKKRPQTVKIEQPSYTQQQQQQQHQQQQLSNPYAQFNPIPNQISSDDFYKLQTRPAASSTTSSTTSTTTTTSTTASPHNYFVYNSQPQIEFPGASGHLYPELNQIPQEQQEQQPLEQVEEQKTKLTTRPPVLTTTAEEEYRMKQYYRKQEANRNRPLLQTQTNSPYEQVQYTPVNLEYEIGKTTTTTTNKPRITFFSPTTAPAQEEDYNTLPPRTQQVHQSQLPVNHRPSYTQNEITDNPVEYEPNPYQLPSELPQLQPNFPGLVNNLKEMKEPQANIPEQTTQEQTTVTPHTYQEPEISTKPTRRPINRVRKPVSTKVTSSVSYSESESSSRRPINRIRRPYGSRNTASTTASPVNVDYDEVSTTSTTRRPAAGRNPLIRNPNRIRYQPTPEERQTLRIKPKRKYHNSGKIVNDEDLDYQRDVLKQNYPVFKPTSSRRPSSSPTAIPTTYDVTTTEAPTSETQQVYTVTPSNSIDNDHNFPAGLLEPMQIAQQYNEYKNNYGPGYFPNQEDINPTESIVKNEINPIYNAEIPTTLQPTNAPTTTTTTTTTTEAPIIITTRRSPFIRRNYPRVRTTTTEAPATTTPSNEEKPSTRNRLPPRKVIKVRARTRRPLHPASPTPAAEEENEATEQPKQNYRRLNRFNQDLYENETPRRRYKQKFQLEGQESQWSPPVKVGPTNNFKPINPKDKQRNQHKFENEPEIVTAGSVAEENKENYEVKVSANYGPGKKSTIKEANLKPEKSFAELLEEVMGKAPEEKPMETTMNPELSTDGTIFEAQKTTIANRILRRGKWKKTRVSSSSSSSSSSASSSTNANPNGESFETAESQNLGSQLLNSLHKTEKTTTDKIQDWKTTTTPMTTAAEINAMFNGDTTTPLSINSREEYGTTTFKPQTTFVTTLAMEETSTDSTPATTQKEESATRRMDDDMGMEDDLEIQPSLFSEVKKQLHELFSIEESDDTAVTAALAAVGKRRQEYTNIKRPKVETTTQAAIDLVSITQPMSLEDKKAFHRELMKHVVYATSSPVQQDETSEAEICYRGRCIKSEDLPANHKLN